MDRKKSPIRAAARIRAAAILAVVAVAGCSAPMAQPGTEAGQEERRGTPINRTDPRVLVVSANLRESHAVYPDDITGVPASDLQSLRELSNFADHVAKHVPHPPDVFLLQEVIAPTARETARQLTKKLGQPYSVVISGEGSNQIGPKGDGLKHKRNTAIVINEAQIEVVGKVGFLSLKQRPGDWPPERFAVGQELAHGLLRDRESGVEVGVVSIHWSSNPKFHTRRIATMRRTEWAREITAFMAQRFGRADIQVMGGEFNVLRCRIWEERRWCDEHPAYRVITEAPRAFTDAVLAKSQHSRKKFLRQVENRKGLPHRIDYIFARGEVFAASRSVGYDTKKFTPNFFSDHKYDYAIVGP